MDNPRRTSDRSNESNYESNRRYPSADMGVTGRAGRTYSQRRSQVEYRASDYYRSSDSGSFSADGRTLQRSGRGSRDGAGRDAGRGRRSSDGRSRGSYRDDGNRRRSGSGERGGGRAQDARGGARRDGYGSTRGARDGSSARRAGDRQTSGRSARRSSGRDQFVGSARGPRVPQSYGTLASGGMGESSGIAGFVESLLPSSPRFSWVRVGITVLALIALILVLRGACSLITGGGSQEAENQAAAENAQAQGAQSEGGNIVANGQAGLVEQDGKAYFVDEAGTQRTGWRKVGNDYSFFRQKGDDVGARVAGEIINGVQLDDGGLATVSNDATRQELDIMVKAQTRADSIVDPNASSEDNLKKCFEWIVKDCLERASTPFDESAPEGWHRKYALDIFDKESGSCISFAVGFAYLANALGVDQCSIIESGGHCWAEINGAVYDPEQAGQSTDMWKFFAFPYSESGKDDTLPDYANNRSYIVELTPRTQLWGAASTSDGSEGQALEYSEDTTGWVDKNGYKVYVLGGKLVTNQWFDEGATRYYLQSDGRPAAGSTEVDGTWYLFDANGALQTGTETRTVDYEGKTFRVDEAGRAAGGWVEPEGGAKKDDGFNPLGFLFGGNSDDGSRYYLETGELATGDCFSNGEIMSFSGEGAYDEGRTNRLRELAGKTDDAAALLAELGEPEKTDVGVSCRPGFEGGAENTYYYPHLVVYTYNAVDGPQILNSVEARTSKNDPDAQAAAAAAGGASAGPASLIANTDNSSITGDAEIDAAIAAFAEEHGDLKSCFDAVSYTEGQESFIPFGDTGRPTITDHFTDERIVEEARAAFVDHSNGNCYTFTVAFWALAKHLGYTTRPVIGTMVHESGNPYDTCWVEINEGGNWNIYDPLHPGSLAGVPYGQYETVQRTDDSIADDGSSTTGETVADGETGADSTTGETGTDGATGETGADGETATTGEAGETSETGEGTTTGEGATTGGEGANTSETIEGETTTA